uniref:Uncharacterized protein n=1 Tax=Anguilla anguilla TaxID=7936 RepID=A0A0E9SMT0_ANGAN
MEIVVVNALVQNSMAEKIKINYFLHTSSSWKC